MRTRVMLPFPCKKDSSSMVAVGVLIVCGLWLGCGRDQEASDAVVSDEPTLSVFTSSLFGVDFLDRDKGWAVGKLGVLSTLTMVGKTGGQRRAVLICTFLTCALLTLKTAGL